MLEILMLHPNLRIMKEVVIIESCEEEINNIKIVRHKPDHCKFPVLGLPWRVSAHPNVIVSMQSRNLMGANMQLFEFEVKRLTSLSFRIIKPTTFLFFHLRGNITYFSEQGQQITKMEHPAFHLSYGPPLKYTMKLDKGHHSILGIALEQVWTFTSEESLPIFEDLYNNWSNGSKHPIILPHKKISKEVWRILADLRLTVVKNLEDNINILKLISKCFSTYYEFIIEDHKNKVTNESIIGIEIIQYLEQHFMFDEDCRLSTIRKRFKLSEWELRKISKDSLGCTVGKFVNTLRIRASVQLLIDTELTINEITVRIGFSSPTTFSNYFKSKTGQSPTSFRKNHINTIQN